MIDTLTLTQTEYVVFDLETTGLHPESGDSIIEIGAVKLKNGIIIDRYDELINPGVNLSDDIIRITSITNEMLTNKRNEHDALVDFMKWVDNLPMVAHNARFDLSFVLKVYQKYNLGCFSNSVIDTLGLSRYLESSERYHNLATLVKRYNIVWDESKHHRGDYDAEGTAFIFYKMLKKLELNDIDSMVKLKKYPAIVIKK